jgi:hypothetical protein
LASLEQAVLTSFPNNCSPKDGASACTTCVLRACCVQAQACADNSFCVTLSGCMSKCDDKGCVNDCTDQYDPGVPSYQDLMNCADSYCMSSCG